MLSTLTILGILSAFLALISLGPYILSIINGHTRPHLFSWLLWVMMAWIIWLIQFLEGAGPGAWPTLLTAILSTVILGLSLKRGHKEITLSDKISFAAGLCSIPLWIITKDPTFSAILVTFINVSAFYPTTRKSWKHPRQELAAAHLISSTKHITSIMALSQVNIATAVFPTAICTMNLVMVGILLSRRYFLYGSFKNKEKATAEQLP